jgi:sporulation protein YlmC with PRC-barrel domain
LQPKPINKHIMIAEDMTEKKLRGSGGYAIARVTDEEQKKGNLGGPELFLAGIGRLEEDRFVKHYCNKCEKAYEGSPALVFENPNEDLGEGVTLIEKGEYKCKTCNATIAHYRKFDAPAQTPQQEATNTIPSVQAPSSGVEEEESPTASSSLPPPPPDLVAAPTTTTTTPPPTTTIARDGFFPMQSLVGMSAYDSEAMLIGKVEQIGLRKVGGGGNAHITIKIGEKEVPWDGISKIGDIILLKTGETKPATAVGDKCSACGYQNESGAAFCAECGTKL